MFGEDGDLPALYRLADASAIAAQARYLKLVRTQLAMLLIGSVSGVAAQLTDISPLAYVGVTAYIILVLVRLEITVNEADSAWYDNRQVAESVKSLAWRYAVGGAPFGLTPIGEDSDADRLLGARVSEVLHDASHLPMPSADGSYEQITEGMRRLRQSSLEDRMSAFADGRVRRQLEWYSTRATEQARRSGRLDVAMLAASGTAVFCGLLQALSVLDVNLMGLAGITAAIVATWAATNHYRKQSKGYALAAHQLTLVQSLLPTQSTEEEWEAFVNDAEDGISREHTSWRVARAQA